MTFYESYINRHNDKPYLVKDSYNYLFEIVPITSNMCAVRELSSGGYKELEVSTMVERQVELVDRFLSPKKSNSSITTKGTHKCTCDFVSVILSKGCQCGGI